MAKKILNLGDLLSTILTKANANFNELYNAVSVLQAESDDIQKAVVYSDAGQLKSGLEAGTDENNKELNLVIGDEIYVLDDSTPDFWVSGFTKDGETFPSIPEIENGKREWGSAGTTYAIGDYLITVTKSREIDLADYQTIANLITTDDTIDNYKEDDTVYPSVKLVYQIASSLGKVKDVQYNGESLLATDGSGIVTIPNTIGKVQGVKFDGTTFTPDDEGIVEINYTAKELESIYGDVTKVSVTTYTTTMNLNGVDYYAIEVEETDTTFELLNSSGQAVVTQVVRNNGNLYYLVSNTGTYYFRRIGGNAVIGGGSGNDDTSFEFYDTTLYNHSVRLKCFYAGKEAYSVACEADFVINYTDNFQLERETAVSWLSSLTGLGLLSAPNFVEYSFAASGTVQFYADNNLDVRVGVANISSVTIRKTGINYILNISAAGYILEGDWLQGKSLIPVTLSDDIHIYNGNSIPQVGTTLENTVAVNISEISDKIIPEVYTTTMRR